MANTTLNGIVLDGTNATGVAVIQENDGKKEASLVPMPLWQQNSDETEVWDFGGVSKHFTLTGRYTDTSVANIKTWVDSIEDLIQGHQDSTATNATYPLTFVDDLRGGVKVKILDFNTVKVEGEVLVITWTLRLMEASELA